MIWQNRNRSVYHLLVILSLLVATLSACKPTPQGGQQVGPHQVMAVESFLADITRNVAGQRVEVVSLLETGMDPHTYEPAPRDIIAISESQLLVENGAGLESWLKVIQDQESITIPVVEASAGIPPRTPSSAELVDEPIDPHFWLDPISVITYAQNIRDGLIAMDPEGRDAYETTTDNYIAQLKDLDSWITTQVDQVTPENRLLVTNHESFGYFADRYGFEIVGTLIPSVSSEAMPTAHQMTDLIQRIKATHARAIFLEAGTNPELAQTIADETGVIVISGLLTHSLTGPDGPADSYINMMKYNTLLIVDALK